MSNKYKNATALIIVILIVFILYLRNVNDEIINELDKVNNNVNYMKEQLSTFQVENEKLVDERNRHETSRANDNENTLNLFSKYSANKEQPLERKTMFLNNTSLYLYPDEGTDVIMSDIQGNIVVLFETTINEENWAYIKSTDNKFEHELFGFVKSKFLSDFNEALIIDRVRINPNISIGMTFDEMKLLYGRNYIALKDFYGDHYIFYFDEERYLHEVERFETGNSYRDSYEEALVCDFTNEYNQLSDIQITSSLIELDSGLSIGDRYEDIKSYCEKNYDRYIENYEENRMLIYYLNENILITFLFDEDFGIVTRIDIGNGIS